MLSRDILLVYEGEFSQEMTKSVLEMAEVCMNNFGEGTSLKRKVFSIMVECLQNISLHADEDEGTKSSIFIIGRDDGAYSIASGNFIKKNKIEPLKSILDQINDLDEAGLKALYRELLSKAKGTNKLPPGLGLIDIARKSGHKLETSFDHVNDQLSYFSLQTKKNKYSRCERSEAISFK
ncbi:MAG: hypothetical protein IIA88_00335 [Bacteroidetes bacterium]|nr:hypothetical protein [Bacteroidota bacterium]